MCQETTFLFENAPIYHQITGILLILGLSSALYAVLLQITGAMKLGELLQYTKRAKIKKGESDD
ncbi:MAG TPA: hypothetical protein DCY07_02960 [Rhodospirillaceae bacterium]|nr:hypothetical protein [Rhodospirillaceae bacterium]